MLVIQLLLKPTGNKLAVVETAQQSKQKEKPRES